MAWLIQNKVCGNCGYSDRVLVVPLRDGNFSLSCGLCCFLTEGDTALRTLFFVWNRKPMGDYIYLEPVNHIFQNSSFEAVAHKVWKTTKEVVWEKVKPSG